MGNLSNISLALGTEFSYLILPVIFFWIAFGVRTFLQCRRRWTEETRKGPPGPEGAHGVPPSKTGDGGVPPEGRGRAQVPQNRNGRKA